MALVILVSVLVFASCARLTPPATVAPSFAAPLKHESGLNTGGAIVYGRFSTPAGFAFGNEIALRLCSQDGNRVYLIRCQDKDSMYGIAVEPGHYKIDSLLAVFIDGRPVGGSRIRGTGVFQVRSNTATYLGDFSGWLKLGPTGERSSVHAIKNNFIGTTDDWKELHPQFASVPTLSIFEAWSTGPKTPPPSTDR